jgi:hypothetical protein
MSGFRAIPGYSGYSISPKGEVVSERGRGKVLLIHDVYGRVSLRSGARVGKHYIGDLLALTGYMDGAGRDGKPACAERGGEPAGAGAALRDARMRMAQAERRLKAVEADLDRARRANALLLKIRNDLMRSKADAGEDRDE